MPERVIVDNAKCAITRACQHDPQTQRSYADCAEGYGFRIDACPPHDPQKKGIVESGVKYLKGNFLPLKSFRDLVDLNAQAKAWVMDEAGLRRHGTTGEVPLARFELERALLRPLPAIAPDLGVWSQATVHRDCHVQFERAFYSVPWRLAGQRLLMIHDPERVRVEANVKETDIRYFRPGKTVTITVDALPGRRFEGTVTRVGQAATSEFALLPNPNPSGNFTKITQRLPVRIAVRQAGGALKPGMMVELEAGTGD